MWFMLALWCHNKQYGLQAMLLSQCKMWCMLSQWYHNKQYGLQAMEDALALERFVNDKLLYLHKVAESVEDFHVSVSGGIYE